MDPALLYLSAVFGRGVTDLLASMTSDEVSEWLALANVEAEQRRELTPAERKTKDRPRTLFEAIYQDG